MTAQHSKRLDPTMHSPEVRDFENALLERVVGQDRAVRRLARVYQVYLAGLADARPAAGEPAVSRSHGIGQDAPGGGGGGSACLAMRGPSSRLTAPSFSTATKSPS